MWPFKKKFKEAQAAVTNSVICIPAFLEDTIEIFAKTNGAYMVVGNVLMDVKNKCHYTFDIQAHDVKMKESFKYAGKVTRVTDSFLDLIEGHKSVIYISGETGSLQKARLMALAVTEILNVCGIGVKVESTGKAFEKETWNKLAQVSDDAALYKMFVLDSIMMPDGTTFSCGMHNIGFKDTIISNDKFEDAIRIISIFNYYQVIDKPVIVHNQTFQTDINSPFYRITEEVNQPYKKGELFSRASKREKTRFKIV
jgi:hypothetical protein